MATNETESSWFARRNGAIRGPFTVDHVKRCILLGRIQLNDELSQDERIWRPLMEFPELHPNELNAAPGWEGYQRLLLARSQADERVSERRRHAGDRPSSSLTERRRTPDRRGTWLAGLRHMNRHTPGRPPDHQPLRVVLLAMLLATLVIAYFSASSR